MLNAVIIFCAKYLFVLAPLLVGYVFATQPQSRRALLIRGIVTLLIAVALAKGGGAFYDEPRPFVTRHIAPLIPHEPDNGFPSDHTLLTAACVLLILPFSRPAGIGAASLALIVGAARVASLLHSPLDIAASLLFAALASGLAFAIERRISGGAKASDRIER